MHAEWDLCDESVAGFQREGVADLVDRTVTFDLLDAHNQIHRIIRTLASHEHVLLDLLPLFRYEEEKQPPIGLVGRVAHHESTSARARERPVGFFPVTA
jgi:hypothetical protein